MVLALVRKGWDLWEEKVKRGHGVPLDLRGIASPKGKKSQIKQRIGQGTIGHYREKSTRI